MMLDEVEFLMGLKYGKKETEIGYEDFLVFFANHKDRGGVKDEDVIRAFETLGEENPQSGEISITRQNFVSLITTKGSFLMF